MGLSSLPAHSEGMLCVILVNTAFWIAFVKGIVRSILQIMGIHLLPSAVSDPTESAPGPFDFMLGSLDHNYINEFRNQISATKFKSIHGCKRLDHDCSVCLNRFEPESEVNRLTCGHVYHKLCLEKWIGYWNITCPMCRTPILPEEEVPSCFW